MADIYPFRGVRYDAGAVGGDFAAVCAPPYDVISKDDQDALYALHPKNVVRLILGREEDRYAAAASAFREWKDEGTLTVDPHPGFYVYHQTFDDPMTGARAPDRMGLICLLKLEDYSTGKVLPHENTLTAAKADRLDLLRATNAQFESIYGLYSDPDQSVESFLKEYDDREIAVEQVDNLIGSSHRVERIVDASAINVLRELLADKPVFIADGHHRYETALNYRKEVRASRPNLSEDTPIAEDYILITLTAFEDAGLLVLPTHRLVRGVSSESLKNLPDALANHFHVAPIAAGEIESAIAREAANGRKAFGLVLEGGPAFLAVLNGPAETLSNLIAGEGSPALKQLDVAMLHSLVLENRLGIDKAALAAGGHVSYTRDIEEALASVRGGDAQAAFILGRPSVKDVRDVSLAGDKMPQKSTFFFPKLLSGLILRDLAGDAGIPANFPLEN